MKHEPPVVTPDPALPNAPHEKDVVHLSPENAPAVAASLSPLQRMTQALAFAFSAVLSPYLVIPVGTVLIVAAQSGGRNQFLLWTFVSIMSSTGIPALYVLWQIRQGKITDVHVMEREQRGGPFLVAVISSGFGALALYLLGAPSVVWGIGVVLLVNGLVMSWITSFWKISMHVAVLTACVIALLALIPSIHPWTLIWMIPALMWARATRGRHSVWQGVAGFVVAGFLTALVFFALPKLWPLVKSAVERVLSL
jgi:hypothetical protein